MVDTEHYELVPAGEPGHLSGIWAPVVWLQQFRQRMVELLCSRVSRGLLADSSWLLLRAASRIRNVKYSDYVTMYQLGPSPISLPSHQNATKLAIWEHEEGRAAEHCKLLGRRTVPKQPSVRLRQNLAVQLGDDPLHVS